jgi:hypothetical protein
MVDFSYMSQISKTGGQGVTLGQGVPLGRLKLRSLLIVGQKLICAILLKAFFFLEKGMWF